MDPCHEKSGSTASSANVRNSIEQQNEPRENDDNERPEERAQQHLTTFRLVGVMSGLSFAVFCMALDNTIMATAIPKITDQFHSSQDIGWYGSSYLLTNSCLTISFGKLYTLYPVKWIYLVALALFEIGSLVCGFTPNSVGLIIGRAITGLGSAGLFSGAITVISQSMPLQRRLLCISLIMGLFGVADVAGPLIGGVFTDYLTWRWCFYINLPFGGLTALAIVFLLEAQQPVKQARGVKCLLSHLDLVGLLFLFPAVICLLLVLSWGGADYPWGDRRIIGLIVGFAALMSIFIVVQWWRQDKATIPPRLIKKRDIWGTCIFSFCITGAMMAFTYHLPIWFQSVKGVSATKSGLMSLPTILGMTICTILSAVLVGKIGYYAPFMYAAPVVSVIGAGLLSTLKVDSGPAQWIGYQVPFGIGLGIGLSQPMVVVQTVLEPDDIPLAIAITAFMESLGGSVAISVAQSVFRSQLVKHMALEAPRINAHENSTTGMTTLRDTVPPEMLNGVLRAYNSAITQALYVGVALSSLAIVGALSIRWISVKGKKTEA
ncbi:putative MFS multidrug transporter [Aspergillus nomiae NRRL 13137]|uniref:Putative MFS multidrug transporter n=1 Tax=Aspergillus nomiae NRRL (strain ATCC 15546 / NRRL 13137 / CBS 260.88 / M93) TaxID=1509407 RepID=A0A0L1J9D4_ASPN3|nr:putative MFS multidrug transporter [Aspergillus nomiae NRRL 13137]KNG88359.1 putative MFS multidrug transporter [Aspergillus nomiae NRRL 13137]